MASTAEPLNLTTSEANVTPLPLTGRQCAQFIFAVYGVLVGTVMLFGLSGNIMTIIIMLRDKSKTTMNRLLAFLAVIDGASLLSFGLYYTTRGLVEYSPSSKQAFFKVFGIFFPPSFVITKVLNQISSYLTMIIACHRYLSICHPHKMKIFFSRHRMQIYMAATVAISILCYVPSSAVMYKVKRLPNGAYHLVITAFQQSEAFKVFVIFRFILNFAIPLPSLTLMACKIVRTLRDSRFTKMTAKEKATRSLTFSILLVIIIFIIFKLPEALLNLYSLTVPLKQNNINCPSAMFYLNGLPYICILINAAVNVIIYTVCLHGFRKQLTALLACKCSLKFSSVAPATTDATSGSNMKPQPPRGQADDLSAQMTP